MAEWDRQEGEPVNWFERFESYRKMGPQRTLLGCVNKERQNRATSNIPGAWRDAAEKWRWKARAEAWDAEQTRLNREAEVEVLVSRRKAWIAQAQAVQGKAVERLLTLEADDLSFRDVLAGLAEGVRLELLARGQPGEITEQQHKDMSEAKRHDAIQSILRRFLAPPGPAEARTGSGDSSRNGDATSH